ncbi:class A beta-lactamase [Burkholderia alba]|uniref:class A beta-lactamase n=1 Tax=Burkholderia alba TaxID=2683677 RepID=UPI002B05BDD2|nr:class A beta-lactamase [Burkholderia alba]
MSHSPLRRTLLLAGSAAPLALALRARAADTHRPPPAADARFAELERAAGGRLGVCALDTANGAMIGHRLGERFPFCSTFKLMLSAAVLARSQHDADLLARRVRYTARDLVPYSPVTSQHVGDGMPVAALCAATLQYSDNTAANLLLKVLGGPAAVTAFARSIDDRLFRLDRWEPELNSAIPGDQRDTTTPEAMARSVRALAIDAALQPAPRAQLQDWLRGNTTGDQRIRAGVPAGWQVGDKTGTGSYGTANDTGVLWPPARAPIVLAVYYTREIADAKANDAIIAAATRVAVDALG